MIPKVKKTIAIRREIKASTPNPLPLTILTK